VIFKPSVKMLETAFFLECLGEKSKRTTPWLEVAMSKVKVTLHVVLGKKYVRESSPDLRTWTQKGAQFVAASEEITGV
jgi:hypothetical protein